MNAAAWFAVGVLAGMILGAWAAYQVGREHGYELHHRETREQADAAYYQEHKDDPSEWGVPSPSSSGPAMPIQDP